MLPKLNILNTKEWKAKIQTKKEKNKKTMKNFNKKCYKQ